MLYYRQKSELSPTWTPAGQFAYGLDLFIGSFGPLLLTVHCFFFFINKSALLIVELGRLLLEYGFGS